MKKRFFVVSLLLVIVFCNACGTNNTKTKAKNEDKYIQDQIEQESTNAASALAQAEKLHDEKYKTDIKTNNNTNSAKAPEQAEVVSNDKLEIVKEGSYEIYGSSTIHVLIVKNNNSIPVEISSVTKAYDEGGNLAGVEKGKINILAPGYTSVISEWFDTTGVASFETELTAGKQDYYKEADSAISAELEAAKGKAFVTVTNNGDTTIDHGEVHVVFLDAEGNIVYNNYDLMMDLKPGDSEIFEITCGGGKLEYDTAEVYFSVSAKK